MLTGLIVLLACQLVGEVVVRVLDVPVPGPVVGMAVFFVVLQVRRPRADSSVVRAGDLLLRHLPLLFVPAGVGIVAYLSLLSQNAVPIIGALVGSWLVGLLTTAAVAFVLLRFQDRRRARW